MAELADRAGQAGTLRALVAAGGDGTVAELVNRTAPGVPISVFPLGTANLLAGYLGIRPNIASFCETMAAGATVNLDAGRANGRIFLLMAGCGFDGEVVERLHRVRGAGTLACGATPNPSWIRSVVMSIRSCGFIAIPPTDAACRRDFANACPLGLRGQLALLCRRTAVYPGSRRHGRPVERMQLPAGLALARIAATWPTFGPGSTRNLADCDQSTARRVRIESDRPVRFQLDGDPGGMLPLDIEVLPGRLAAGRTAALDRSADHHAQPRSA